jgi:hypothetical protein
MNPALTEPSVCPPTVISRPGPSARARPPARTARSRFASLLSPFRWLWSAIWRIVYPRELLRQLMHVRFFLFWVTYVRYLYYARISRRLRCLEGNPFVSEHTVMHNLRGILPSITSDRSLWLLRPLSVIEAVGPIGAARLLCIGPRSEGEILRAWAHGFSKANITAVDLISYSPWIDVGDMHQLPYADNSFDMLMSGWVLAYSESPERAAREMVRVVRPGGLVAVGVEYREMNDEEIVALCGYIPGSSRRIQSVEEILSYFGGAVDHVYFNHGIVKGVNSAYGNMLVIFSVKK